MATRGELFTTIRSEGGLLPPDLLARIATGEGLDGRDPEVYGLDKGERLNEAISRAWTHAQAHWASWQATLDGPGEVGISEARNQWLLPLFRELGYGRLTYHQAAEEVEGRRYLISHRAGEGDGAPPVHTIAPLPNGDGARSPLDHAARSDGSGPRRSPHGLLQEYLNQTDHLWGVLTDGCTLRLLRDNASLSRAAYVEVDLEAMFREGAYADFVLFYLLLHRSRLPQEGQPPEEAWLEIWRREGEASGARALADLRGGVEKAIRALGQGFIEHRDNEALRQRLRAGDLSVQGYYRQLLRLVYRLLFLLAAEERDLLFAPNVAPRQKEVYRDYYGVNRLRDLARRHSTDPHDDLWQGMQVLFRALREEEPARMLGLSPLGGLFDSREMRDVDGDRTTLTPSPSKHPHPNPSPIAMGEGLRAARLGNGRLLEALRGLGWRESGGTLRRINYRDMDVEELGSVYEGLLEQQPALCATGERTEFDLGLSGERKTTGSYYTNPGLVRELIRSALEPAIEAALAKGATKEEKRRNLLDLKVCDPACGSGHFLLAAARRIGRAVAEVAAGDDEPSPAAERAAIREAIGHCIYGVDLNPLAVDLCKVALWLEGQNAGKPLQFLDHHIRHGNSLVGATEAAMEEGVPDAAFDPVTGDAKAYAATIKKKNRDERKHKGQRPLEDLGVRMMDITSDDARKRYFAALDSEDQTLGEVAEKTKRFHDHQHTPDYLRRKLTADLWTAAFFWPLQVGEAPPPTDAVWRRLAADPQLVDYIDARTMGALKDRADSRTVRQARRLSRRHGFFHWELEFEDVFGRADQGFDVILGNPPWERIVVEEQEFFERRFPELAKCSSRERRRQTKQLLGESDALAKEWQAYVKSVEEIGRFLKKSNRLPLTSTGKNNLYSCFTELADSLVHKNGRAALVVPTGIVTDDSNQSVFGYLLSKRRLICVFDFENREKLFASVDSRYKFCLLTIGAHHSPDGSFAAAFFLTLPGQVNDQERIFSISAEDIALLNPNTGTCPVFRNAQDADLAKKLYATAPILIREVPEEVSYWDITLKTALHMSNDIALLKTQEDLLRGGCIQQGIDWVAPDGAKFVRLYESKMFNLFNHRFGTFSANGDADEIIGVSQQELSDAVFSVKPRFWVAEEVRERFFGSGPAQRGWWLAFRKITRSSDVRTAIFSLLPLSALGDSGQAILFPAPDARRTAIFLANCSSFVLDYATRQKLSGMNLSFFIVKQLPVLPPETYTPALLDLIVPRVLELAYTAWDLAPFARDLGYEGEPFRWDEERRALLRAELDGIYAHLYGLNRDDFAYILEQFPIVKRKDVAAFGEYRTARLCLEAYDYFAKGAQTRLWEAVREIEIHLTQRVVRRLRDDLSCVPDQIQEGMAAERVKQGKSPRATSLTDFLGAGYLPLLGKVIKANRERFDDLFPSNRQVDEHLSPLVILRNTLAHTKELAIADKVRRSGETEVRWFAEKLGLAIELVPAVSPHPNPSPIPMGEGL